MTELIRPLPHDAREITDWLWERFEPYYARLRAIELTAQNVNAWLADWTQLSSLLDEAYQRLNVATTQYTADQTIEAQYNRFSEEIYPKYQAAEQTLKEKLLASELAPVGFEIPLRSLRAEAALFRQENLALQTKEQKLEKEYDKIIGSEVIAWRGEDRTPVQMLRLLQEPDRATRQEAWHLIFDKRLENRAALNDLWGRMLRVRLQMAKNANYILPDGNSAAGIGDYRAFRWQQYLRFDYSPDDCKQFAAAIEQVVVPVTTRLYEKYRARLDVATLRPWDLQGPTGFFTAAPTPGEEPLRPFQNENELIEKGAAIFHDVDPELGAMFDTLRAHELLDLGNRKNKAPGAYCQTFEYARNPFIFMNAVGTHEDVQTLLHETGHAFHAIESFALPFLQQHAPPLEFCEVASMGMEFLGAPYLNRAGGFYDDADAARARVEKLETALFFWPYMAVVDLFQHWVYENPTDAQDPENCDAQWDVLWERFMRGVDWSGLEQEQLTGWHRKLHIFTSPFYYVEYGIAQLGAAQLWANALRDQSAAVRAYRRALALGYTVTLPQLFETAGMKFKFDAATLHAAVALMETTIHALEK
ncbi:MAG: M3 family oligoendopeptidase [Chloroflexi bacterium]|nr:M3 family oligoendopeptidase [Chloroflexota bacterium]